VPTKKNLSKLKHMGGTGGGKGGPRSTAFSMASGFSSMSHVSFMKAMDSPFGGFGFLPKAALADNMSVVNGPSKGLTGLGDFGSDPFGMAAKANREKHN